MNNQSLPRSQPSSSFGRNDLKPISFNRSSFRIHHYSNSNHIQSIGSSPRTKSSPRYSFSNINSSNDPSYKDTYRDLNSVDERAVNRTRRRLPEVPKSSGLLYSTKTRKELSSIDKFDDPSSNGLICAGKTHLGYYRFSEQDHTITCIHDFMTAGNSQGNTFSPNISKRGRQSKLSTIADVKTGFHNHKNYIAVCSNSTAISIYDINKTSALDNPVVTTLSEHTRSINSFDFNTVQTNLIISGGQDGCIKIWDLRSTSKKSTSKCDVSINTASDSIRDVKWMPIQNFAHMGHQVDTKNANNAGFKFASIHDSGLLLKFDLRQPHQVEKRINAHTGPGLCLNWHPHQDYIATGGRDGKCCLWYIGDKPQYDNSTSYFGTSSINMPHLASPSASTNLLALPEITINTGFPVTKLKFCPSYDKNILNSLLALSSMTDEAGVSIYSLARKYIPKHELLTLAPSLGLVWWDEKLIFNIDKEDRINGWNTDQEPTMLENLTKCVTTWRDIEGNGLLFVDQKSGGYEVQPDPGIVSDDTKKGYNHRISMSSLNSSNLGGSSGLMGSIKKGISHTGLSSLSAERPSFSKSGTSYGGKSFGTPTTGLSHNNSTTSSSPFTSQNENLENKMSESPMMITLDLPYILNNMRISHMPSGMGMSTSPEVASIKESPVKVFKFLARELEFSYTHEKKAVEMKDMNQQPNANDEEIKEDLMKRFGLSENTTWTALINKKSDNDVGRARETPNNNSRNSDAFDHGVLGKEIHEERNNEPKLEKKKSALTESINELTLGIPQKIDLLLELIPICSHNASVYSYIDDLPNFKIWLVIRDSLLWDLKRISTESSGLGLDDQVALKENSQVEDVRNVSGAAADINELVNSGCASYATSGINSFIEEAPQALRADSEDSIKNQSELGGISNLKQQLMGEVEKVNYEEGADHDQEVNKGLKDWNKYTVTSGAEKQTDSNDAESAIIEDDEEVIFDQKAVVGASGTNSIPILRKRQQRPSFIDTFMTDVRSPSGGTMENDFLSRNRRSHSFGQSSPVSKISSFQAASNGSSPLATLKKLSSDQSPSPLLVRSPARINETRSFERIISMESPNQISHLFKEGKSGSVKHSSPPWSTEKLLRQIYRQSVELGNILLAVNILLLFQNIYHVTTAEVVKNSLAQFTSILHQYELFEISAAIFKYCPWEDIMNAEGGQSVIQLFCEKCGKLITNDMSKEKFTLEAQRVGCNSPLEKFGYWYCDSCKKPNSLCVVCERPMKTLAMGLLDCGHEAHFECFTEWFLNEGMTECPAGCLNEINL